MLYLVKANMEALEAAFREHGFDRTPAGLRRILTTVKRNVHETPEACRRRTYRRLFGILWYGNHIGEGKFRGRSSPTYVFPTCLKEAVRERIDENLRDYPDPEGAAVYHVTFDDLFNADWPATKK